MGYTPTIGLEIHAELKTKTKMFCDSPNNPDEKQANVNVCPICMGHPGTLPVINKQAVEHVLKVGLALGSKIPERSKFDRKNYFYPDLPKGYQISQYDEPLCLGGVLEFVLKNGEKRKVRIKRIHLEEDAGKLIHPERADYSLVDFNRAGVPLMELVTEPDIHSGEEARAFAEELQLVFRYLDISNADMEKGQMRLEANISVSKSRELGTKVEVKNLNSFRALEDAIKFEVRRQSDALEDAKKLVQETRGWDDVKKQTYAQRRKEGAEDYRYFPEPDLPPLDTTKMEIERLRGALPELPWHKRKRFHEEFSLGIAEIDTLVREPAFAKFFEQAISEFEAHEQYQSVKHARKELVKLLHSYLMSDLKGFVAEAVNSEITINPEHFAHLVLFIHEGKISSRVAKDVLRQMFETGEDPETIIREKGLFQVSDTRELEKMVREVVGTNEKAVADYRAGKGNALQFLVGQIMARSKGKANPKVVDEILKKMLG